MEKNLTKEESAALCTEIERAYGDVTLKPPDVVHDWFLKKRNSGEIKDGEGYEEFLSRIILAKFRADNPGVTTPGLLNYDE